MDLNSNSAFGGEMNVSLNPNSEDISILDTHISNVQGDQSLAPIESAKEDDLLCPSNLDTISTIKSDTDKTIMLTNQDNRREVFANFQRPYCTQSTDSSNGADAYYSNDEASTSGTSSSHLLSLQSPQGDQMTGSIAQLTSSKDSSIDKSVEPLSARSDLPILANDDIIIIKIGASNTNNKTNHRLNEIVLELKGLASQNKTMYEDGGYNNGGSSTFDYQLQQPLSTEYSPVSVTDSEPSNIRQFSKNISNDMEYISNSFQSADRENVESCSGFRSLHPDKVRRIQKEHSNPMRRGHSLEANTLNRSVASSNKSCRRNMQQDIISSSLNNLAFQSARQKNNPLQPEHLSQLPFDKNVRLYNTGSHNLFSGIASANSDYQIKVDNQTRENESAAPKSNINDEINGQVALQLKKPPATRQCRPHSAEIPNSNRFWKFLNLTFNNNKDISSNHNHNSNKNYSIYDSSGETCNNGREHVDSNHIFPQTFLLSPLNSSGVVTSAAASNSKFDGETNAAFENEGQNHDSPIVKELKMMGNPIVTTVVPLGTMEVSGNTSAMVATSDSFDDGETPENEQTPLNGREYKHSHPQRCITFVDEVTTETTNGFHSISEEGDEINETYPLFINDQGRSVQPDFTEDIITDLDTPRDDVFMNEEYDNLSLEFIVPGSKRHIRLHRQTFFRFLLKYCIFFFSFLYWAASLASISFSTWMLTRKTATFNSTGYVMLDPYVLLCLVGGVIFLVAFLGLSGALRENILLLKMFHITLTAVFALEIFLVTLVFIFYTLPEFRRAVKIGPEEVLKEAVTSYFDDPNARQWIDNLQREFQCCGVSLRDNGYLDWTENKYFNCSDTNPSVYRCSVPISCCIFESGDYINYMCGIGIIRKDNTYIRRYIHTKGCMMSFGEWLAANTSLIAYVGLGFFIPQICGVVATRYFIENLKKRNLKKMNEYKVTMNGDAEDEQDDDEEESTSVIETVISSPGTPGTHAALSNIVIVDDGESDGYGGYCGNDVVVSNPATAIEDVVAAATASASAAAAFKRVSSRVAPRLLATTPNVTAGQSLTVITNPISDTNQEI